MIDGHRWCLQKWPIAIPLFIFFIDREAADRFPDFALVNDLPTPRFTSTQEKPAWPGRFSRPAMWDGWMASHVTFRRRLIVQVAISARCSRLSCVPNNNSPGRRRAHDAWRAPSRWTWNGHAKKVMRFLDFNRFNGLWWMIYDICTTVCIFTYQYISYISNVSFIFDGRMTWLVSACVQLHQDAANAPNVLGEVPRARGLRGQGGPFYIGIP